MANLGLNHLPRYASMMVEDLFQLEGNVHIFTTNEKGNKCKSFLLIYWLINLGIFLWHGFPIKEVGKWLGPRSVKKGSTLCIITKKTMWSLLVCFDHDAALTLRVYILTKVCSAKNWLQYLLDNRNQTLFWTWLVVT